MKYPMTYPGIFTTVNGEGRFMGKLQIFVRLGGCSVGCKECDTDYKTIYKLSEEEIVNRVNSESKHYGSKQVWITGGEPTDCDLIPLIESLRKSGYYVALATSGIRPVNFDVDFLSVSPHFINENWIQRTGNQLNFVLGLNGLNAGAVKLAAREIVNNFQFKYVTPAYGQDYEFNLKECLEVLKCNSDFTLGVQAHKVWNLP